MNEQKPGPEWVWVVFEKSGMDENLYALEDEKSGVKFIPVFQEKEDGVVVQAGFKKIAGAKYEVEAMRIELVAETARKNKMDIYILDGEGLVMERLTPMSDA